MDLYHKHVRSIFANDGAIFDPVRHGHGYQDQDASGRFCIYQLNMPSPTPHFHCPQLSASRRQQIIKEANLACDELIRFSAGELFGATNADQTPFHPDDVRVKKSTSKTRKSMFYLRGEAHIQAPVVDLMAAFTVHDDPNDNARLTPDLLQSSLLYELKPYDSEDTTIFIGVWWMAIRAPYSSALSSPRDFCLLELQRRFTLPDGRNGFARCLHSVTIEACPDLQEGYGYVRGSMYRSGYLAVESQRDPRYTTDAVQAVYMNLKGAVPRWVTTVDMRKKLLNLRHLKTHVETKRIAGQTFARDRDLKNVGDVTSCYACLAELGRFRRRFNCHKCGEVVCSSCKTSVRANMPVAGRVKITICSLCSLSMDSRRTLTSGQSLEDLRQSMPRSQNLYMYQAKTRVRERAVSWESFRTLQIDQTYLEQ